MGIMASGFYCCKRFQKSGLLKSPTVNLLKFKPVFIHLCFKALFESILIFNVDGILKKIFRKSKLNLLKLNYKTHETIDLQADCIFIVCYGI